ncbi:MAG: hypothetical protein ACE5JI_19840 [Acidobacteriota bacterium]
MDASVGFFCTDCSHYNSYSLPPSSSAGTCERCGHQAAIKPSAALRAGGPVDRCPQCDNGQFYLRKDFPQQLGCLAVIITVALSSIALALWGFFPSLSVLFAATLIDFWLYHRLPEVTVCYRCHGELRGFKPNPSHRPFDIHRAEEYEQGR